MRTYVPGTGAEDHKSTRCFIRHAKANYHAFSVGNSPPQIECANCANARDFNVGMDGDCIAIRCVLCGRESVLSEQ
jgi:hypothetical protein